MGIFSLFGKKNKDATPGGKVAGKDASGRSDTDSDNLNSQAQLQAQRRAGRSTVLKIDAIESAMARDMFRATDIKKPEPPPKPALPDVDDLLSPIMPEELSIPKRQDMEYSDGSFQATIPMMGEPSEILLASEISSAAVNVSTSEMAPAIEEAAVLFSNGQIEPVEQLLRRAIAEDKHVSAPRIGWWMLFDLFQITNQNNAFDSLSIDYASQFETSPPAWTDMLSAAPRSKAPVHTGATPTIAFIGKLDETIGKTLERLQKLALKSRVFRLEFARVTAIEPSGCVLLLSALKALQKSEPDLILVGAPEFAEKIRATIEVGRRDETQAPWLLLLEILQLLNLEKEFEETSMDYCVTFEVSPPAFTAPKNSKISTAPIEVELVDSAADDRFMMPAVIEGEIAPLIKEMTDYASERQTLVIDCGRLRRVDFTAAALLLNGLSPLAGAGKTIEFHEVNHLVTALFHVMGLHHIAQIAAHKY